MILLFALFLVILYRIINWFPVNFPRNSYKLKASRLSVFYGAPGSGKSTIACYFAQKALKAGYNVYSNVPILGCKILTREDIGKNKVTDGLLILDEVGIEYNNRDFKSNFSKSVKGGSSALEWFKKHRHEGVEVMIFSQGFDDMDSKLRTLGTDYYIVRHSLFPRFITYKRIKKKPTIDELTRQPIDAYDFVPFSGHRIAMWPLWKYFDSFERMNLPDKEWKIYGDTHSVKDMSNAAEELATPEETSSRANLPDMQSTNKGDMRLSHVLTI